MNAIKIFPSLIAANPLYLANTIDQLSPFCDGFHIDIMDNHFVPNLTWGPFVVNAIARYTKKTLLVHCMVENFQKIIKEMHLRAGDIVSFHIESNSDFYQANKLIKEKKSLTSIAISPKTPLIEIFPYLADVDQVLLMSVEPGFSGQSFLKGSIERLKTLQQYKQQHGLKFEIGMDGGINATNIHELVKNGATEFAVASAIFSQADSITALKHLYDVALEG